VFSVSSVVRMIETAAAIKWALHHKMEARIGAPEPGEARGSLHGVQPAGRDEGGRARQAAKARKVLGWVPQHADLKSIVQSAWDFAQYATNGYEA
jgi:hypothetical protein